MARGRTVARLRRVLVAGAVVAAAGTTGTAGVAGAAGAGASAAAPGQAEPEPLSITVSPTTGIQPGQQVQVTIDGAPDATVVVGQCATSWGGPDNCQLPGVPVAPGERPTTVSLTISDFMNGIVGGNWWYCGDCYVTAFAAVDEAPLEIAQVPIHVEPGELALRFLVDSDLAHEGGHAPADLQEGDVLNTAVTGTRDVETAVALCHASVADTHDVASGPCTPPAPVAAGSGPGRVRLTVSPTFTGNDGSEVRCRRNDCIVALASADEEVYLSLLVEFRFAGELTADPAAGLADGQLVQLTGHDVSPTYVGPPFWFFPTTGNWVLAQCEAAIADAPSLYNVFDRCTNVPGRTDVDVPASDDDLDLGTAAAQASITSFLGRPTDCATAPGACVLALLRLERDGAVTVLPAPLAFV